MPIQLNAASLELRGFAPQFFQSKPATQGYAGISFPTVTGQKLEDFEFCNDFPAFQEQFISQLNVLRKFITDHVSSGEAKSPLEGFRVLQERLFNPYNDDYGRCKAELYGDGKRHLDQLVGLLNEDTPLDRRINTIMELGNNIKACPTGAATNLTQAVNRLRCNGEDVPRLREEMTTQLILEHLREAGFRLLDGSMEIHYATAFKNAMAGKMGFDIQPDFLAKNCGITQKQVDACLRYIESRLTPLAMAKALAEESLSEFTATMQDNFRNSPNTAASFDNWTSFEQVATAIEPLKARCGDEDVHPFITQLDKEDNQFWRINTDPTLLVVKILESPNVLGAYLDKPFEPEEVFKHPDGNTRILRHNDLIWATENGKAHLLESRHLQGVSPHQLGDSAVPAIEAVVRNSSPLDILYNLPSSWLDQPTAQQHLSSWASGIDIKQLVSILTVEALPKFLEKNAQLLDHLPLSKRLELAEIILTTRKPSDVSLSKVDAATLFSTENYPANSLQNRFSKAIRSNDHRLIEALGAVLLGAEKAVASPMLDELFPMQESALNHLLRDRREPSTIVALGNIAVRATGMKYLKLNQLISTLAARDSDDVSKWTKCIKSGQEEQIDVLGELLSSASKDASLNPEVFFKLVSNPSYIKVKDHHNLFAALTTDNADAVGQLGDIVRTAYENGTLEASHIENFLTCNSKTGGKLFRALPDASHETQYAFAFLLLEIDDIKREKEGAAFSYISFPEPPPKSHLSTASSLDLVRARSLTGLSNLRTQTTSLLEKAKSENITASDLGFLKDQLKRKIWKSRLGLYLVPGKIRAEKEKIFSDIISAWKKLDAIEVSQPDIGPLLASIGRAQGLPPDQFRRSSLEKSA